MEENAGESQCRRDRYTHRDVVDKPDNDAIVRRGSIAGRQSPAANAAIKSWSDRR
ncbi:MAG TPA: hypothetical protein VNQ56_03095 [Pseudolabrys sp.]|nr:hypothetical protein [Pseudolabrys sp.]